MHAPSQMQLVMKKNTLIASWAVSQFIEGSGSVSEKSFFREGISLQVRGEIEFLKVIYERSEDLQEYLGKQIIFRGIYISISYVPIRQVLRFGAVLYNLKNST